MRQFVEVYPNGFVTEMQNNWFTSELRDVVSSLIDYGLSFEEVEDDILKMYAFIEDVEISEASVLVYPVI